jgi:hypothetical protein
MGVVARGAAVEAIKSESFRADGSLARQRGFVRTHLKKELREIDTLVTKLLTR